jgi:hypothetical protein
VNTLSRDRAKDMATDYEPAAQDYAERRIISLPACPLNRFTPEQRR